MDANTEQVQSDTSLTRHSASEAFEKALGGVETPEGQSLEPETNEALESQQDNDIHDNDTEEFEDDHSEEHEDDDFNDVEVEETEENDPWSQLFEVDGEKITAKDLRAGYMKNRDYTHKTQALAEKRKHLEETEKGLTQLQERSATVLGLLTKQAHEEVEQYRNVDWNKLLDADQSKFIKHKAKYDQAKEKLQQVQVDAQNFFQQIDLVNQQKIEAQAQECLKELKADIPNWDDGLYSELIGYGVKKGMREEQLINNVDPHFFKMLNKAYRYDKMKATAKQKKAKPKKVMGAGGAKKNFKKTSKGAQALDHLRKSGSRHDAADAFANLL